MSSIGWSLPTGFNTPFTYAYILYFIVLLLHRQIRDDHACKAKYGDDWEKVSLSEALQWAILGSEDCGIGLICSTVKRCLTGSSNTS